MQMQTIISSLVFQKKVKGKYDPDYVEEVIEKISDAPRIGKKLIAVNNIFTVELGFTMNKKAEYNLIYYYQGKNKPIFVITIFRKKEKDILSKIISSLIDETGTDLYTN